MWEETRQGMALNLYKPFVKKSCHSCVILMSVPCRYDLDMTACVNNEVKVFIRKLWKQIKVFVHTELIYMELYGNLFTKHGLHVNTKGKGMAGKKIVIKKPFQKGKRKNHSA